MHTVKAAISNTVAAADYTKFHCVAAGAINALFYEIRYLTQVEMSRDNVTECIGDADNGAAEIIVVKAATLIDSAWV
jgi:hypothetical protein